MGQIFLSKKKFSKWISAQKNTGGYLLDKLYISDGYNDIDTSETLGKFKDELLSDYGPETYITEFVSGGPKNYAYRLNNGKIIEKN